MAKLTFDQVKKLVADNNRSTNLSDKLLICLIWKESGFDPAVKNSGSSATGLMQMTTGAVQDVNNNTPKGVHYDYSDMTDAAKNIQAGSYYADLRIKWAGGDVKAGLEKFGTGSGYADNIVACEACMAKAWDSGTADQLKPCLFAIHT